MPPLDYALVYRIKRENPNLVVVVNGGIGTLADAARHLEFVDGVMLGRAAYQSPALLADIDPRFFDDAPRSLDEAVEGYLSYIERRLDDGVPLHAMTRHMLGLFNGRPGARLFRRHLSDNATRAHAGIDVLRTALSYIAPHPLPAAA